MSDLRCPFCGSVAIPMVRHRHAVLVLGVNFDENRDKTASFAMCINCQARGPVVLHKDVEEDTRARAALAAWRNRK